MGNFQDDRHCRQPIKMRRLQPFLSCSLETEHIHTFSLIWGGDQVEEGCKAAPGSTGRNARAGMKVAAGMGNGRAKYLPCIRHFCLRLLKTCLSFKTLILEARPDLPPEVQDMLYFHCRVYFIFSCTVFIGGL